MSTVEGALIHILGDAQIAAGSPYEGEIRAMLENVGGGRRFTAGNGSGQVNQVYFRDRDALGAGATDNYNLLAAGALLTIYGATVDLDELKIFILVIDSGAIRIEAPAANFLPIFALATDSLTLGAAKCVAFDFGDAGLTLGANALFDITETSGAATASYRLLCVGAS